MAHDHIPAVEHWPGIAICFRDVSYSSNEARTMKCVLAFIFSKYIRFWSSMLTMVTRRSNLFSLTKISELPAPCGRGTRHTIRVISIKCRPVGTTYRHPLYSISILDFRRRDEMRVNAHYAGERLRDAFHFGIDVYAAVFDDASPSAAIILISSAHHE